MLHLLSKPIAMDLDVRRLAFAIQLLMNTKNVLDFCSLHRWNIFWIYLAFSCLIHKLAIAENTSIKNKLCLIVKRR